MKWEYNAKWTDNHVTYPELVSKELDHLAAILQHNAGSKKEVNFFFIIFQKEKETTFNHFKNSKIAQIYYYVWPPICRNKRAITPKVINFQEANFNLIYILYIPIKLFGFVSLWAYFWKNDIRFRWFHSIETSQNLLQEVSLTKKLVVGLEFSPFPHRKHGLDLSLKFSIKYSSCQLDIINKLYYSLLCRIMMALKSENENKFNNSEIVMAKHWQGSTQSFLLYSTKILISIFFF